MKSTDVIERIKEAVDGAPRNAYVAELHLQVIKYSEILEGVTGKEFCEKMGIGPSFGTEFAKMRKISGRLKKAGLDVDQI